MAWDDSWERIYASKDWGKYPEIELVRFIAKNFYTKKDREKIRMLDLGCGTGANSWFIAKEGFSVYGIDGSKTAIKKVNKRFEEEGLKGVFTLGDFSKLHYDDKFFDVIFEVEALYCNVLKDIKKVISEMYRVLKPGGKIYSQFFGIRTTGYGIGKEIERNTFLPGKDSPFAKLGITHFIDVEEIKELFSDFDIEINFVNRTRNDMKINLFEFIITGTKR